MGDVSVSDCAVNPRLLGNRQLLGSISAGSTCWVRNNLEQVRFHALPWKPERGKVQGMTRRQISNSRTFSGLCGLLLLVAIPARAVGEPQAAAVSGFNSYVGAVEARLARQHRSQDGFL